MLDKNVSPNYFERYKFYDCCVTGNKFRKNWQSKIEWGANCKFFVKCPNPKCKNWIEFYWNTKNGFYKNINLINNFQNCCIECNKLYDNPGLCSICNKFNFTRDQNHRGKDSYSYRNSKNNSGDINNDSINCKETENSHIIGCSCSENWFKTHNNDPDFLKIVGKASSKRWENPEYVTKISKNLGDYLGNPDWAREVGKLGRKQIQWLFENDEKFREKFIERAQNLGYKFGPTTIYKAIEKQKELWENDHEWAEKQRKNSSKIGKKYGAENLQKARLKQIEKIKESLNNINISLNSSLIDYNSIISLRKNDICGAYVIKAKFKGNIETNKENDIYNILVCKSVKVYDEIYWALRVISQPEKQDKVVTNENPWTIAKWWYIANLYYDFEFELITDENGVDEETAILTEAKYGFGNDMLCDREQIERDGYSKSHSYWSL